MASELPDGTPGVATENKIARNAVTEGRPADATVGELIGSATEQLSHLVRDELRLAEAELTEKVKHAGKGIGAFSTSGVLALYAVGAGVAAAILGLSLAVDAWLAALIVMGVLLVAAGVSALLGKKEIQQAKPIPERTVANVKADVAEIKEAGHR